MARANLDSVYPYESQPAQNLSSGNQTGAFFGDTRLLNSKQLARAMGVSGWVIKGIKRAAQGSTDTPFIGRYSTLRRIEGWMSRNPKFVASHHLRTPPP